MRVKPLLEAGASVQRLLAASGGVILGGCRGRLLSISLRITGI